MKRFAQDSILASLGYVEETFLQDGQRAARDEERARTGTDSRVSARVGPSQNNIRFIPESKFFTENRSPMLPSPDEVRAINKAIGQDLSNRPPPVRLEALGLLVKYGADVGPVEAQTQAMVHKQLLGRVPVPEVYGWAEDDSQRFIYMELVEGDTLEQRWERMSEKEKLAVCGELRDMVTAWRGVKQPDESGDYPYIGSLGKRPLNDSMFSNWDKAIGPFEGPDAVRQFQIALKMSLDDDEEPWELPPGTYLTPTPPKIHMESADSPVVFTHADIALPNILVSCGEDPKVLAVIDWCQSGWFPAYWEYCTARLINGSNSEWCTKYVPMFLDSVEEEPVWPSFMFLLSTGRCY